MYAIQWYDYFIFALTLLICLGVGLYFSLSGGKQRTTAEYLSGEHRLSPVTVGASIALSITSSIMVIGASAEVYEHGIQRSIDIFGVIIGVALSYALYLPMFYNLKITSLFEVSM